MENNKSVGEIIKSEREKVGLSKRELSRLARISDTELTRIEEGIRKNPSPRTLRKISNYIDVNYNDLMYMIGLGIEVSPLNPFIKNYYDNLKDDELDEALINVEGSKRNAEKLVLSFEENLKKENITEQEKELLLHTIKDTKYQINTSSKIVNLIMSIKIQRKNEKGKRNFFKFIKKESDVK